ncbi:hypothetical protein B6I21_08745 [candidate division KSB1 bacterium 4572_119]|nr:MAG: hypothetical protein B6I21_08745 [candidate division KSB1 bacterium 4572_119]
MSKKFHILFVCSGNLCRSPMAEGLLKKKLFKEFGNLVTISSAGTLNLVGRPATPNAISAAKEKGVDITRHQSKSISEENLQKSDIVLVMTEHHKKFIRNHYPQFSESVFLITEFNHENKKDNFVDVPDPIGEGLTYYRKVINQIEREIDRILPKIKSLSKTKLKQF